MVVEEEDGMILPRWMRRALLATAAMNVLGFALFLPSTDSLRQLAGLPQAEHPLYLATIAMFVLLFGLAYLWAAIAGRAERLFLTLAAFGKLSFVGIVVGFWLGGGLPLRAALVVSGDLVFGLLFLAFVLREDD
jgi:hypothetical protein